MLLFTKVTQASNVTAAFNAAREATLITTGVKDQVDKAKSRYANEFVGYLKKSNIHNEVLILGAAAKTARDKRIDFVYKGNAFSITPNSMTVRIPF
jgi:hypothetical protein